MSYNLSEPQTFINIKLTDAGRRNLSLGNLKFTKAILSDREVNYGIDRSNAFNITSNRILSPSDVHPNLLTGLDGNTAFALGERNVNSAKQFITASTESVGFFTGETNSYAFDVSKYLGTNTIDYSASLPSGTTTVELGNPGGSYFPSDGDLVFIPWEPIQNSGKTYDSSSIIASGNPTNGLWYRVVSGSTPSITLDREVPNFGTDPTSQVINVYFYPFNGIDNYYGSATTVDSAVWNMNIIRTNSVEGTSLAMSGYTTYGSIEYNGTKQYLGFSGETSVFGIIHYTNQFTGNTYAEQLIEKTIQIEMPLIMWHGIGGDNGTTKNFGLTLYDVDGDTVYDSIAGTTYRFLKDGTSDTNNIVGRVYHKLKLFAITDAELLTAMTYKSNRLFTLPQLELSLSSSPKFPLTTTQASGFCQSDKTYFVTYAIESNSAYTQDISYGYPSAIHCAYISKINGANDSKGNPQFLVAKFPTSSFPYLRSSDNMDAATSYSGTGWNTNKVQLLVNEVDTDEGFQEGTVDSYSWIKVSDVIGNGIYTGDTTDNSIDPLKLNGFQFIVSRQDFESGTTYELNTAFTNSNNVSVSGLTFGSESFFFGNISADIMATTYKSLITVFAKNDEFNSSVNLSYDSVYDTNTYITEVAILDDGDNIVAIGKPTYPIKKSNGRYLAFQLEMDF